MADGELGLVLLAQCETTPVLWVVGEWWRRACCGAVARHAMLCSNGARVLALGLHKAGACVACQGDGGPGG